MEKPGSATTRRSTRRKPLGDVTNTPSLSSLNPKRKLRSEPEPETPDPQPAPPTSRIHKFVVTETPDPQPAPSTSGAASRKDKFIVTETPDPQPAPSTSHAEPAPSTSHAAPHAQTEPQAELEPVTPAQQPPPTSGGSPVISGARISTVYKRKYREAAREEEHTESEQEEEEIRIATSLSCPPFGKNRRTEGSTSREVRGKSYSVPNIAKKRKHNEYTFELPEDFVRERNKYFAEVDEEVLHEEEVSDIDNDD